MRFTIPALVLTLIAPSVSAGETPWQEVAPGVQIRLISTGQVKPDGQTLIGLEIDMPENTKTYWRVPGETGLPTELDFGSDGAVHSHQILWPYPTLDTTGGYADYVYYGPTVLPIDVTLAAGASTIELSAILGICSDVCIPAQARFSLPLNDTAPDRANGLRLRQAMALAPIDWDYFAEPIGQVQFDARTNMLHVPISDPALDPSSLIAATASGEPVFGAPQKSPEQAIVLIPVLGEADMADLTDQPIELTFLTEMGAFEVARSVTIDPAD